jgi:hypothetical protein
MELLHQDKLETYIIPQVNNILLSKLVGGQISSDNCATATTTSENIAANVKTVSERTFIEENERLH